MAQNHQRYEIPLRHALERVRIIGAYLCDGEGGPHESCTH